MKKILKTKKLRDHEAFQGITHYRVVNPNILSHKFKNFTWNSNLVGYNRDFQVISNIPYKGIIELSYSFWVKLNSINVKSSLSLLLVSSLSSQIYDSTQIKY